jgi:predicted component of type VI protein secretion system
MQQGNDRFRLVVRRGPQPNQVYDLNKDIITVGRDITNDIVINDPEASRHHMRLTRGAGGFTLEDLGSTNGTFINGQRLTGAKPLNPGDMVGMGETVTLAYERVSVGAVRAEEPEPASPYVPPQPVRPYESQAPESPFAPPTQQDYAQRQQPAAPQYGAYGPAYAEAPAPPGYGSDYDPYAVREEQPRSTMRWVAIGCVGLLLFCCCATIASTVIIDQACLWDQIPLLSDLLNLLGFYATC